MRPVALLVGAGTVALLSFGGAVPATSAPAAPIQLQQADRLDAAAVLQRVAQTYAAMAAYSDRGVSTVRSVRSPELNGTQRFATLFERSRQFTWVSDLGKKGNDYRITSDGVSVAELWHGRRKAIQTLGDAIAGATGISNSAAFWVPTLLMPEMIPHTGLLSTFERATYRERLANAEANGETCFVLRLQDSRLEVKVWVGTRDFLIRRIEHRAVGRDAITTTDYTPQTDIALTPQ